ncbi:hypothetical protein Tco_0600446 [Tanacetum coccineum]|uniref:Reverse transcriptase domain-containing protein n=1 Tax=Tanacetum coccineum TaxID=301880 RepID=A0ABQ4WBR3_9ASTR
MCKIAHTTTTEPCIPPLVPPTPRVEVEKEPETLMDDPASTAHIPPPGVQPVSPPKPKEDPKPNPHQPKIPYPSRLNKTKLFDKNDVQVLEKLEDPEKFLIPYILQDLEDDPRVSIILGRPFLRTATALVDLYEEKLTLRVENEYVVDKPISGSTTFPSDSSPSLTPFETISSPTTDIDIIESILERFTDEPALIYSSLLGDDDDLFDFKFDTDKWKVLLYGDSFNDTYSENDKSKGSNTKSLIDELESSVLLPQLLDGDLTPHEELSEIDTLTSFPSKNKDKVFNPGIFIHGSTYFVTNLVTQENNFKKKTSSEASLILEERNFMFIPSERELPFHYELPGTMTLLSFSFENKDKVFNPGILISKRVHSSILGLSHRTYETFKIINVHLLNKGPMKIFPFFCFCPKDKGIRGESS